MNYEFNLLHHVDAVAKRISAAAAAETETSYHLKAEPKFRRGIYVMIVIR